MLAQEFTCGGYLCGDGRSQLTFKLHLFANLGPRATNMTI